MVYHLKSIANWVLTFLCFDDTIRQKPNPGPLVKWPKTPASHAGNSGSNPLRVTTCMLVHVSALSMTVPQYSSLAQSVEHAAVNRRVVGSSPTGGATKARKHRVYELSLYFQLPIMLTAKTSYQ